MKKRKIGIIVLIALVLVAGGYKKMLVEIEQEAKNTTLPAKLGGRIFTT